MASGNTMGAKWWTDGNMNAPMLPKHNALVVCPSCCVPVWMDKAKNIDQVGRSRFDRETKQIIKNSTYDGDEEDVKFCNSPAPETYLEALKLQGLSTDEERYIRFRLWWGWNDVRRDSGVATPLTEQEAENLEKLIPMLDVSTQIGLLAKAEALRELGRFDECIALIDTPEARTESDGYAANILYWAEQHDPYVRQIREVPWDFVRSGWEQLKKQQPPFEIDPSGPPVFKIDSDRWWVKVLGMLQHNWALIEEQPEDGSAIVYFAHDEAPTSGRLRSRWAIIDSLEFDCRVSAMLALKLNGFCPVEETSESIYLSAPEGVPYDARATSRRIYSEEGYWKERK